MRHSIWGLKDLATVSRAGDNGVKRASDNGIHENVSFCVFQSSVMESINALRQDVEWLHLEIRHIKTVNASTQLAVSRNLADPGNVLVTRFGCSREDSQRKAH